MTDVVGNPEEERRAEFYHEPWSQEAVSRYFYCKVRISKDTRTSVELVLLLVYYETGCYDSLHVSVNVITALDTNWLALCLSASKDSAEEAGAGAGLGLEEHLELTPTTFRKHGSFVTTLPPRGDPCNIFCSVWGFVCVFSHCCHFDLQSTTLDQSHPVTPAAPLYIMCISAYHGAVSSIPGWNHLTVHYLDFWFLIPISSTRILNLMTSEPCSVIVVTLTYNPPHSVS